MNILIDISVAILIAILIDILIDIMIDILILRSLLWLIFENNEDDVDVEKIKNVLVTDFFRILALF